MIKRGTLGPLKPFGPGEPGKPLKDREEIKQLQAEHFLAAGVILERKQTLELKDRKLSGEKHVCLCLLPE